MKKRFCLLILLSCFILVGCGKNSYVMDSDYELAYLKLRVAASQSALYGGGTISTLEFDSLGTMVKEMDKNNDWFRSSYGLYARTEDTLDKDVTYLCDDSYCAKFVVEHKDYKYKVLEYSFYESKEKGYRIYVGY